MSGMVAGDHHRTGWSSEQASVGAREQLQDGDRPSGAKKGLFGAQNPQKPTKYVDGFNKYLLMIKGLS
jgi:hypothetical protein